MSHPSRIMAAGPRSGAESNGLRESGVHAVMARYTGPVCRLCRREKMKLFLKGPKCDSMKCPIERRTYPPGVHGRDGHMRTKEYELQLREKQKARRVYGLLEKQFRNLYEEANRADGVTGETLLRYLE